MRCLQIFWERIPHSWTGVGKGAFSIGWQFIARYIQQGHSHIYNYNHTVICAICRFSCRRSFHANLTTSSTLNVILTACEMELTQTWSVCSFCLITTVDMFFMFKVAVYQILLNEYE